MTKPWRIHAEAVAEIRATFEWYSAQRLALGREFLAELRHTTSQLRAAPTISTPDRTASPELKIRRRRVQRFPYAVVFMEATNEYVILAVEHLAREPGYWRERATK